MEDLLTPVSAYIQESSLSRSDGFVQVRQALQSATPSTSTGPTETPERALQTLKNKPDYESLSVILQYLVAEPVSANLWSPNPWGAQVIHVLIWDIIPTYWDILAKPTKSSLLKQRPRKSTELWILLSCLRSVPGLNAVLLALKQHLQRLTGDKKTVNGSSTRENLRILLQVLQALLDGHELAFQIWTQAFQIVETPVRQKSTWQEFLSSVGGSKLVGLAAESEGIINNMAKDINKRYWIADGKLYSAWLARNIAHLVANLPTGIDTGLKKCGELLSSSLRTGYNETVIRILVSAMFLQGKTNKASFARVTSTIGLSDQKNMLYAILKICSQDFLSLDATADSSSLWWEADAASVSSVAALISVVLSEDEIRTDLLVDWLTSPSGAGIGEGVSIRRVVLAVLAKDKTCIERVLDKSIQLFGDRLYIKHAPTLQQEVHCQVLLLVAGYIHRQMPLKLKMTMMSGAHLGIISNRLSASSARCRFLGMVVGEALSALVDKEDTRMDFRMEETKSQEAQWYKSLVYVWDSVGTLDDLRSLQVGRTDRLHVAPIEHPTKPRTAPHPSKSTSVGEVETDERESDDGLPTYAQPNSDAEDSDEDPTLITRNKPTAPVYIRDLITYLRDAENFDKHKLGLITAASLIRRKASFGTEVSAHVQELATLLVGIQDKYDLEHFQDMRLQGMIAILIAAPLKMGQWYSRTFFDGDYSISQRASVLTTLGLGARELGGYGSEDASLSSHKHLLDTATFPSKTLPLKTHKHYALAPPPSAIDTLSTQLIQTMISPMAASLADKLTGPSILKIRTFSSRMAVENKRKRPITNEFAKIVADGFFFPLTGRFFMHLKVYGSSARSVVYQSYLLTHFIKTLALLLHASGPSTLSLPQMTSEFWDLLLALRAQSLGDLGVMEALLFALLTILEINENKRSLVDTHGRQLLETQEWVESIFGRLNGGGEEEEKARMLGAGVLVRIRDVVEKHQRVLLGDLASFQS